MSSEPDATDWAQSGGSHWAVRESLDFSVLRCRPNSEGFCASFCNWVNSLREAQRHELRSRISPGTQTGSHLLSSVRNSGTAGQEKQRNQQNVHQQPSLSGLPSLGKGGHCASEGTLWRQVTTTGPYGSLTTGNTATRRGTLREIASICERGWGGLEGSQPGRLIIEEKTLGKKERV